jgi:DNA helicase-2/ATP-dependent DNA helicase PcrA
MAIEALADYAATEPGPAGDLAALLDTWQAVLPEAIDHRQNIDIVEVLSSTTPDTPAQAFVEELAGLGAATLIADPGSSHDARELERMRAALAPGGAIAAMTVRQLGDRARAHGRVMAATIHGVKGLEFDVVILCDCEEGRLPHWGSINSQAAVAAIEEDRRKFYVSITRARQRVYLVWAGWRISRRGNRYDIELSRFARALAR